MPTAWLLPASAQTVKLEMTLQGLLFRVRVENSEK